MKVYNKFSYYRKPITNVLPYKNITLDQLAIAIKGDYYKEETEKLRRLLNNDPGAYRIAKGRELDYVTFGGTFTKRHVSGLTDISGYVCMDFDHLKNEYKVEYYFDKMQSEVYDKEKCSVATIPRMIFRSPSGFGLKVICDLPNPEKSFTENFEYLKYQYRKNFGIDADNISDISRACFVCHDPLCWIAEDEEMELNKMIEQNPNLKELMDRLDCEVIKIDMQKA